ncbi:MAG TPA: hypothetical protein DIC36_02520 [Gammaproteobacteria bacterium]|nr:hypothetical protein [Gammaproteobacteria bacterium]
MSSFDFLFLGLLATFAGMGALRGGLREVLSLSVWLFAILSGWLFADSVSGWFEVFDDRDLRLLLAFLTLMVGTLALLTLGVFVLRLLLPRPAPDLKSRVLGGLLGGMRGAIVVVVLMLLAGLTSVPKKEGWRDSLLVGVFLPVAQQLRDLLPAPVARQFRYG